MVIFFWHVALSRETLSHSHLPAARPLLCHSVGCLQSLVSTLHRPGPSVLSSSGTSHDLPSCSSNNFSYRRLSLSQTMWSLRPCHAHSCPCSSAAHRSALAQDCCQCTVVFSWSRGSHFAPDDSSRFLCFPRWDKLQLARPPFSAHSHPSWCRRSQSRVTVSVRRLCVCKTTRSSGVQQTLAPILSRTASSLRTPRSHLHCDTCPVCSPSRVCSTSACGAPCWVSASTILLTSQVPARSAGSRLRDMISVWTTDPHVSSDLCVWWSTWHSELVPQAHFSLLGESLPAALEIAEIARTTAGWPLSSASLESTWSVGTPCFPPCSTLVSTEVAHVWFRSRARTAVTVRLLRSFSLDSLDTSVSRSSLLHAFHSELSAPPDNKSRFQCSATRSRSRSSMKQQSRLRYHVVNVWDGTTHTLTCFALGERAAGFVSHMFTHALTVCTQGMILSDWTTLIDLCVSSTAHKLSQSSSIPWHFYKCNIWN